MHIRATYQPTPAEIRRGLNQVRRRGLPPTRALPAVFALLSVFGFAEHEPALGGACAFGCVFYVLVILFSVRLAVRKDAARLCRVCTVTLTDGSLAVESALSKGELAWAGLVDAQETPEFFLLYTAKRSAAILPKRTFTAEQATELRAFLATR